MKTIERRAYYSTNERPDVWFEPTEVWEIRGADLTLSAVHKSAFGLIHPTRGVSLRPVYALNSLSFARDTIPLTLMPLSSNLLVFGRPLHCLWRCDNGLGSYWAMCTCNQMRQFSCRIGHSGNFQCQCRFPRFIRLREDKGPEDASTPEVIR